jgi:hypothetical protein
MSKSRGHIFRELIQISSQYFGTQYFRRSMPLRRTRFSELSPSPPIAIVQ